MGTIGEKNPLAGFLHDKQIAIGQTVRLPEKVARQLLGFVESLGKATQFDMKLIGVREIDGIQRAEFETLIKASTGSDDSQSMNMTGRFVLQVDTCRMLAAEFHGPVSSSEKRGPAGGQYTISADGKLDVAIKTQYGTARSLR